jgi:hypothetical protein
MYGVAEHKKTVTDPEEARKEITRASLATTSMEFRHGSIN